MNVAIIGTGYVGLVTGTGLAEIGHNVICIDKNIKKIKKLKDGIIPFFEPGLEKLIIKNIQDNRLFFSSDINKSLKNISICFICVETPKAFNGSSDISNIISVSETLGENLSDYLIVINKSTSPIGTSNLINNIISERLIERNVSFGVDVISSPEFLSEGNALDDFFSPSRIVLGFNQSKDNIEPLIDKIKELYGNIICDDSKLLIMDAKSAEMTDLIY